MTSSLTTADAPILRLNANATELAIVADRVKLFSVSQQRLSADITQSLAKKSSADVYTCATWGSQKQSARVLLVGTQAGEVRCYDTARAELRWAVAGAVDGAVASLSCPPVDASTVLAIGRTGGAAVLDLSNGTVGRKFQASKHTLSALAALPGQLALLAGSGVQLFDVAGGSRVHKFTGHANPVVAVAATPDGRFICTAAEGERHVAVWNATLSKSGKRKHKSAAAQLGLDGPAVQLLVMPSGMGAAFYVAALTQGGGVWLFECTPGGSGGAVESRLWGRSTAGGGKVLALGAEAADAQGASLVLVAGSTARPVFQRVRVDKQADGGEVEEFEVEAAQSGVLLSQKAAGGEAAAAAKAPSAKERAAPAAVVDAGGEGTVLASKVAGTKRGAEQDIEMEEEEEEEEEGAAGESEGEEEGPPVSDGPTFAERLAALQLQEEGGGAQQQQQQRGKRGSGAAAAAAAAAPTGPLKADSLSVLLGQALQSGDRALLERCLTVRNEDVIRKTAARLSAQQAALFLKAAVQRLQSAPARGEQLAGWIRAVLLAHAGSLVAMAGMQGTLAYLYQIIQARLASYHSLLALAGRLDVVLAHAQRAAGGGGAEAAGAAPDAPLVVVEVGSDDAIEVEDAFGAANGGFESDEDEDSEEDLEGLPGGSDLEDELGEGESLDESEDE